MNQIAPQLIRQVFLILIILLVGSMIFVEMLPYLMGILGAITIYILLRKWMVYLEQTRKWKPAIAASVLMLFSFVVILLPIAGIVMMLGNKIGDAVSNSEEVIKAFKDQITKIEYYVGYDLSSKIDAESAAGWVSENVQVFVGSTFNAFIAIGLMYFMLYYMFTNRRILKDALKEYIPLSPGNITELGKEVQKTVRSNAIGIPLVAIAQGFIALIGFWIFGIEDAFFWFVIVTVGSMIPFVGTLIGILPVFLIALSTGNSFQAWGILLYGFIVVGSTDNIIRLYVLKRLDDVHPLITLIGVIIGVPIFGFIGLIFGPLLISIFMALVRIYRKDFGQSDA
uniref:AI-2E family transporter n=1 Tax=Gelidibacter sp. TaxID=2018083 RepID=UPI00404A15B1